MEDIKLVVWDLDNTLWKGTLSEEGATIISEHVDIVKELAARGIMSSVSSKNDYAIAKKQLEQVGLWDFIIFPHINWNPKGQEVKLIITECQLRAENVLFIDDNLSNRKEVEFYNKGINTAAEDLIDHLLQMQELKGKDDSSLSKLKQYKLLEKRRLVRGSYADNHQFLKDSQIKIRFVRDLYPYKERILELINRTNQLNYTKVRLNQLQLDSLLSDDTKLNVCIHVIDKYGDYGICGFYSLDKETNKLIHFLFSCRLLNLDIESYVYQKLLCPYIKISPPVASQLDREKEIDWIEESDDYLCKSINVSPKKTRVLILGGCDLRQMCHYIDESMYCIKKEFNYPNNLNVNVHKEHTLFLKSSRYCSEAEKVELCNLPFCDKRMFDTTLFSDTYDVLVYSVLMNYTQVIYKKKNSDLKISAGGYRDVETLQYGFGSDESSRKIFNQNWLPEGQQKPEDFEKDLLWLVDMLKKPIVFINGAEIPDFNANEIGAYDRHVLMNKVLDEFVKTHKSQCSLLDVRKYVTKREDCTNVLRHYQRNVYVKMAQDLMSLLSGREVKVKQRFVFLYSIPFFSRVVDKVRKILAK